MHIERAAIPDVLIIRPRKIGDERGFFSETFRQDALAASGVTHDWVQENHAYSARRGIVRGLHFQRPPMAQAKLLRVLRGAIYDVAVDIRAGSKTFGRHIGLEISADNWTQIYVPPGFAHGYCALSADTEVLYKVSAGHGPAEEGGLRWDDPALDIVWPIAPAEAIVNKRDQEWPSLAELVSPF